MDSQTRRQLLSLNTDFYRAHAAGFDASRGHQPWPGWTRLLDYLPAPSDLQAPLRVLDAGCGNARLAAFLDVVVEGPLRYVGVDSNAALLEAARDRLGPTLASRVELIQTDFLASPAPGASLPDGPFDFVALFGVLHHVPGRDWRQRLILELARRVAPRGVLALAAWQFAGRARFERRRVAWDEIGPVLGAPIDEARLEVGDGLLRFGSGDEMPPRYCHQLADAEFDDVGGELERHGLPFEALADYRADGAESDLNRYCVLRRGE